MSENLTKKARALAREITLTLDNKTYSERAPFRAVAADVIEGALLRFAAEANEEIKTEANELRQRLIGVHHTPDCTGNIETCPIGECATCAVRDCPHGDSLHYHHDGCPACSYDEPQEKTS